LAKVGGIDILNRVSIHINHHPIALWPTCLLTSLPWTAHQPKWTTHNAPIGKGLNALKPPLAKGGRGDRYPEPRINPYKPPPNRPLTNVFADQSSLNRVSIHINHPQSPPFQELTIDTRRYFNYCHDVLDEYNTLWEEITKSKAPSLSSPPGGGEVWGWSGLIRARKKSNKMDVNSKNSSNFSIHPICKGRIWQWRVIVHCILLFTRHLQIVYRFTLLFRLNRNTGNLLIHLSPFWGRWKRGRSVGIISIHNAQWTLFMSIVKFPGLGGSLPD
jgi:hypothetical protein